MIKLKTIISVWGFLILCVVSLMATETGEIQGKVIDETGEGLPSVEITVRGPNLQGERSVISTPNGDFYFPLLPIGKYALTFKLEGFVSVIQENVIVRLGRVTRLTATMRLSEIQEEIVVFADTPLIDTTSIDTSFY
jgi:hypothetical protein